MTPDQEYRERLLVELSFIINELIRLTQTPSK